MAFFITSHLFFMSFSPEKVFFFYLHFQASKRGEFSLLRKCLSEHFRPTSHPKVRKRRERKMQKITSSAASEKICLQYLEKWIEKIGEVKKMFSIPTVKNFLILFLCFCFILARAMFLWKNTIADVDWFILHNQNAWLS